ncbi:cell division protein ZipA [Pseudomonas sp. F1_0610]|uniref:cell division protein ZipA n=1 Tax=Pseudomonas sp. F1_0610 TaxID=3114284 RepID=UPI0039C261DF
MDFGLRTWLIVIGVIVIGVVLVDAWRRVYGSKSKLKFKLDRNLANSFPEEEPSNDILGPVRVTKRAEKQEPKFNEEQLNTEIEDDLTDSGLHADIDEATEHFVDEPEQDFNAKETAAKAPEETKAATMAEDPKEIFAIFVVSKDEAGFKGPALLQCILESGLRYGDMDIFHRYESVTGKGETLFSMANALRPGTFDINDIDNFSTKSVCFFFGLPGPKDPKAAFDLMAQAAAKVAHELNGELKDDHRSVLTAQTMEHYRQRIVEFERQRLMHKH